MEAVVTIAVIRVPGTVLPAASYNAAVVCLDVIQAVGLDVIQIVRVPAIAGAKMHPEE